MLSFVAPVQTQTGKFAVTAWLIGGDGTASVSESDFSARVVGGGVVPVRVISKSVVHGQTRVVLLVVPPSNASGAIVVSVAQNAFTIGTTRFPAAATGQSTPPIAFDTTGGVDAITWNVVRAVVFNTASVRRADNTVPFTFEIRFSEMVQGPAGQIALRTFSFSGAETSDVAVADPGGTFDYFHITGRVLRTASAQVLNLNLQARGARRFVFTGGGYPAYRGTVFPETDLLLASVDVPALELPVVPEVESPRRQPSPVSPTAPPVFAVRFRMEHSTITTTRFSFVIEFHDANSGNPINVAADQVRSSAIEIRDGASLLAGASIVAIAGQDNWRRVTVALPLNRVGAVFFRFLKQTVRWPGGLGPAADSDSSPAISYQTPAVAEPEPAPPMLETQSGPDETQNLAVIPVGDTGGGGFRGPDVQIIAPVAGQAIRISEYIDFNSELTAPGRLTYHRGEFYTYDAEHHALYHVTSADGTAERVGMATDFGVGESLPTTLFSFGESLYLIGGTLRRVIRLNTETGSGTLVGANPIGIGSPLGAVVYQSHILVAAREHGLYLLDASTWQTRRLPGNERYSTYNQMELELRDMTVHQGRLYGIGGTHNCLYEVDALTGRAVRVNPQLTAFGLSLTAVAGLGSDGRNLYATDAGAAALYTVRTHGTLPGETADILIKFERPVVDFDKSDIMFHWTDDDAPATAAATSGVVLGELDPGGGQRGTVFQLPVYHKPGRSGVLSVAIHAGSAVSADSPVQGTGPGTGQGGATESGSRSSPAYGPPVPRSRRIPYRHQDTTVIFSVPPTTTYTETRFLQTATFSTDIQATAFTAADVDIQTVGVTLSEFRQDTSNRRVFSWVLTFPVTLKGGVGIGIAARRVRDAFGRAVPSEATFVSFYVDVTQDAVSTEVAGTTTLCEETYTIGDNPMLQGLLPEAARQLRTYGGVFTGVLEYLRMEGLDVSYAVVQIAKPEIGVAAADMTLPAAAVLVEITARACRVIETFAYSLLAPRSLVQDGEKLYAFIGSHYAYEYLPQWTNPEPIDGVFTAPYFEKPHQAYRLTGGEVEPIYNLPPQRPDADRPGLPSRYQRPRAVVPDYFIRGGDATPVPALLAQRGILLTYNARTKQRISRQRAWRSTSEDPVQMAGTLNASRALTREDNQLVLSALRVAGRLPESRRRTPGYGIHGGMAAPMVAENGTLHMVPGYGDLRYIKSSRYPTVARQAAKVEPVTDGENWQWIQQGEQLIPRLPVLETNGKTYYEVLQELARTLFCYLGYDAHRNFVFKFKEPKQALLRNPVSNRMGPPAGYRNLALELTAPNVALTPKLEKLIDVDSTVAGRLFTSDSGVYFQQHLVITRINLTTGIAEASWDLSTFTVSPTSNPAILAIRSNCIAWHGGQLYAIMDIGSRQYALYRIDLEAETLTRLSPNTGTIHPRAPQGGANYRTPRGLVSFAGSLYFVSGAPRWIARLPLDGVQVDGTPLVPAINPFSLFASEGSLWVSTAQSNARWESRDTSGYQVLFPLTPQGAYGDGMEVPPGLTGWFNCAGFQGQTLVFQENALYTLKLTGLVKVHGELMRYQGISHTAPTDVPGAPRRLASPVLVNLARGQRGSRIPGNHDIAPVFFIDWVISMTADYFVHPINKLVLRSDASHLYNIIKIRYDAGTAEFVKDMSTPGELKRVLELEVPLDRHQLPMVKWLAERYARWYQKPQILADATLKSAFYLELGDVVLIEEPESIQDEMNLFQVVSVTHQVKGLTTAVRFRQIRTVPDTSVFGQFAETALVQGAQFSQVVSKAVPTATIVALPYGRLPTGVEVEVATGRVHGIPRDTPDAGESFKVAFSQIVEKQIETKDVTFTVTPVRLPVWDVTALYFFNAAAVSVDLGTGYVTSPSDVTFALPAGAPAWLTLTGSMLTGTNPRTALTTVAVQATNADGTVGMDFFFGTATDVDARWGTGVWGTFVWRV